LRKRLPAAKSCPRGEPADLRWESNRKG
jgi:hypothetical protein